MTAHTQGRVEPKVMTITINGVQGAFFVAAVPETDYAVAITGSVSDTKEGQDKSFAEAERIAACWNACIDIDTEQLAILDDNDTTLKKRYEALQDEMKAVPLGKEHTGFMVDYSGMIRQCTDVIKRKSAFQAEILRQFQKHLEELGKRFYAGDLTVVDEFLQLYCVADDDRKRVVSEQGGAA